MNAFEYPDLYYYSLIPIGIATIIALSFIPGLLWCCCKKGRRNGDSVPKVTGYVERGAQPNPGSCSGSQESNQLESGETVNMLYFGPLDPVTPKITPSKKYIRGASQTEQLLENTDDRSPDSSFRTLELGQLFESATSASSRGPLTQFATPNFPLESGQLIYPRQNTTGETIKNNLYPLIPIPRTSTLPSPKRQSFDSSIDSPHCVFPYSQSQEKITTNSSLLDHTMCPSQVPTVLKSGDSFKFTEKQTLEDLRNSEIIVTNSIEKGINSNSSRKRPSPADALDNDVVDMHVKESRNDFNLEESLRKVRQDTEKIINPCFQEIWIGESNEGSNLSDKSSVPEVERSSSHKFYPNHETETTSV